MTDDIRAIDVMNYLFTPERAKRTIVHEEILGLFRGNPPPQWGKGFSGEEVIAQMDEGGFEKVLIPATKMWSYRSQKLIVDDSIDEIYELVKKFPDRFVGLAGYNPLRIMESLAVVEKAVKEYGFKGVYCHLLGFDVRPDDRRMYPLYAKCVELGVPVSMQV
jgi:predicted TIM-barrel fold metal-dependent hydrolase